jgi:hypothetical protein
MAQRPSIYGLVAEFDTPEHLVDATWAARREGYRKMDAYTPYPVHGLAEPLDFGNIRLPYIVFIGGMVGAAASYWLQYWTQVIDYPINVGGRPLHSWPAFVPPTFETAILFAALAAVLGMFALNGLPMPYHPLFNVPRFALASQDRFFLAIEATDPNFDYDETRRFLESLHPREVADVPH